MNWFSLPVSAEQQPASDLRMDLPQSARIHDYLLGGKSHFAADREAAQASVTAWPALPATARAGRSFMQRVVRVLAAEHGVRQFINIGTGFPAFPNVHNIAQDVIPDTRVAYIDNDPIVLAHARALMPSAKEGGTYFIEADLRDPDTILSALRLSGAVDFTSPTAVLLTGIMHFFVDAEELRGVVRRLLDEVAPRSFLALTAFTADHNAEGPCRVAGEYNARGIPLRVRNRQSLLSYFDGCHLLDPGVTLVHRWRPDAGAVPAPDRDIAVYGGVAAKPY
ncbi:SAM-dependent methyltransferase [Kitasatospora sp. NPDC001603]|uniref:SAM-dependent methyltransferase n=1 Tax=Kitasatospora sp. NPDC001603 TaxID=3154388 RepID=UPI003328CC33